MGQLGDYQLRVLSDGRVTSSQKALGPQARVHKRTSKHLAVFVPGHRYYGGLGSGGSYTPAEFQVYEILEDRGEGELWCRHLINFDKMT